MSTKVGTLFVQSRQQQVVGALNASHAVWKEELCKDIDEKIDELKESRFLPHEHRYKQRSSYFYFGVFAAICFTLYVAMFVYNCAKDRSCAYEVNSDPVTFFICNILSGVDTDH